MKTTSMSWKLRVLIFFSVAQFGGIFGTTEQHPVNQLMESSSLMG